METKHWEYTERDEGELQVHLHDYNYISTHVIARAGFRHTLMNYALVLFGVAVVVGVQIYSKVELQFVLLLLPIPFYGLTALLVENDQIIAGLVAYFYHDLRPKIAAVTHTPIERVMTIEDYLHITRSTLLYRFLAAARFAVLLLPAPVFVLAYWLIKGWSFSDAFAILATIINILVVLGFVVMMLTSIVNPPNPPKSVAKAIREGRLKNWMTEK